MNTLKKIDLETPHFFVHSDILCKQFKSIYWKSRKAGNIVRVPKHEMAKTIGTIMIIIKYQNQN